MFYPRTYINRKRRSLKKITFAFILFLIIFLIINYSKKSFLSVNLTDINNYNLIRKYAQSFSGHENSISDIDYVTRSTEKRKNVIINSKRHLGSIDTKLFDEQDFILKKKFNMNNLILFPFETDNPYEDDRILAQMSYVPVQVLEVRISYINNSYIVVYVLSYIK
uniref:Putative alpha(1,3)fucosyltransferase n=1 Tax=Schistosoma mansoni TaxID=6183 RepID=A0A5K4ESN2_SCHMA